MSKVYRRIVSEISAPKQNNGINDRIKATYLIIGANVSIQRKRIAELAGRCFPAIDCHIAILIREELVEHRGSNKSGGYYARENTKE